MSWGVDRWRFMFVRLREMEERQQAELDGRGWVDPSPAQPLLYPPLRPQFGRGGRYPVGKERKYVLRPWQVRR